MRFVEVSAEAEPAVLSLAPLPGQETWSGNAATSLQEAAHDPRRHPYAILEHDVPVGFLVLDEGPSDAHPEADLMLRGFFVDGEAQGRGVAGRALASLPDLVHSEYAEAQCAVLTVNVRNPVARRLYLRYGWIDRGEMYLGGDAGPQHVLHLDLRARHATLGG